MIDDFFAKSNFLGLALGQWTKLVRVFDYGDTEPDAIAISEPLGAAGAIGAGSAQRENPFVATPAD